MVTPVLRVLGRSSEDAERFGASAESGHRARRLLRTVRMTPRTLPVLRGLFTMACFVGPSFVIGCASPTDTHEDGASATEQAARALSACPTARGQDGVVLVPFRNEDCRIALSASPEADRRRLVRVTPALDAPRPPSRLIMINGHILRAEEGDRFGAVWVTRGGSMNIDVSADTCIVYSDEHTARNADVSEARCPKNQAAVEVEVIDYRPALGPAGGTYQMNETWAPLHAPCTERTPGTPTVVGHVSAPVDPVFGEQRDWGVDCR